MPHITILGGGPAGLGVAFYAHREGVRFLLAEASGALGGLCRTLERCQLRPTDLVFEISEQESIGNFSIFREVRDYYRKLGFQIALDDTGAGYASLEAVMELSPDFIKVDRTFVHRIDEDPARQELLRALRSVADRIGSRIIAQGLDPPQGLPTLGGPGIPFGQGWLFGKPTPLRARSG